MPSLHIFTLLQGQFGVFSSNINKIKRQIKTPICFILIHNVSMHHTMWRKPWTLVQKSNSHWQLCMQSLSRDANLVQELEVESNCYSKSRAWCVFQVVLLNVLFEYSVIWNSPETKLKNKSCKVIDLFTTDLAYQGFKILDRVRTISFIFRVFFVLKWQELGTTKNSRITNDKE